MGATIEAARGRWRELLSTLGGLTELELSGEHCPCPLCGGTDRYRFEDADGTGSWFCNQCGGKQRRGGGGAGLELLTRKRGWTAREGLRRIDEHLRLDSPTDGPRKAPEKPYRRPEVPPPDAAPPALDRGAVARWCYRNGEGEQLFWVVRVDLSNGGRAYLHVVWLDGGWHRPNKRRDGFTCDWPMPRPLYGLADLAARPEAPVIVVEGEKTADAAAELFPGHVVVTWSNGAKSHAKADWSPLQDRDCWLSPDNDLDGRNAMVAVGDVLRGQGCRVRTAVAPPEAPEGWDLADATGWTTAEADEWLAGAQIDEGKLIDGLLPMRTGEEALSLNAGRLLSMLRIRSSDGQMLRYNEFSQTVEVNGQPIDGIDRVYLRLASLGYSVKKQLAMDCLIEVAKEHRYDPVRDYLNYVERNVDPICIDYIATTYLRPEDAPFREPTLYDYMLKATMIGAVKRAFQPGCKFDTCCVIAGDGGARKSWFWRVLGGPFFSDQLGGLQNLKDDQLKLHRSWIMEWPELDRVTQKAQTGQVKAFITTQCDIFRAPYDATVEEHPRRGIIVSTANRTDGLLADETGNRRFWIVPTTMTEDRAINIEALEKERDQLWAGAMRAWRRGESSHLPPHLLKQVNEENENYLQESPWISPIQEWLRAPVNADRPITADVLLREAIQKPIGQQTRADQMQVSDVLKKLGYVKCREMVNGTRVYRWVLHP